MEIKVQVRAFLQKNFHVPGSKGIEDGDSLLKEGIVDSIGLLDLIAFLEETFAIKVADEELLPENLDTIQRIETFVLRKQSLR